MSQSFSSDLKNRLQWSLFSLRLGVFVVMLMWTLDKFVNPGHSARIFEHFYGISGSTDIVAYILGALQLILVLGFMAGIKKRITYGLIFLMHGASTLSSYAQYLDGFNNLLFFAAWPMWAACFALYMLRDEDTKFTVKS
ncbi:MULTISPECIES: hypothetical protein [Pseudoalteromonas]|uniref:hypothetical protein n=1 Tax=Pseudoalteromonas TaxID=53246 RepID=UPI0002FEA8F8|nr:MULTISPECIES: hypothetical protein [Pseudoalteromonas]MCF6146618.1 hypothetical protein [Pseudoalteromonas mariniglutinosa NCIMB 1770]TMN71016.1 hypothetical protein CWB85_12945 [Pseudoalteromonas sp. S1727]